MLSPSTILIWSSNGETCQLRMRQKSCWIAQPSPHLLPVHHSFAFFMWQYAFFNLHFLADIPGLPIILFILGQDQFQLHLGLPDRSLHNWVASLYSSQDTCPCFHYLCISFLPLYLTNRSQLSHASLLFSYSKGLRARVFYGKLA